MRLERGGGVVADIFATIAATSNALLVAVGQSLTRDIVWPIFPNSRLRLWSASALAGLVTMLLSLLLQKSVMTMALSSVALVGAGVAPAVLVRVAGWRHTGSSLLGAVFAGLIVAIGWMMASLDGIVNEALPGILTGLLANYGISRYR